MKRLWGFFAASIPFFPVGFQKPGFSNKPGFYIPGSLQKWDAPFFTSLPLVACLVLTVSPTKSSQPPARFEQYPVTAF